MDEALLEQGRRVFEDTLRHIAYAPEETVILAGEMAGPDGPVVCGYWRVFPDGSWERVDVAEAG